MAGRPALSSRIRVVKLNAPASVTLGAGTLLLLLLVITSNSSKVLFGFAQLSASAFRLGHYYHHHYPRLLYVLRCHIKF